jgi:hypothetical protein
VGILFDNPGILRIDKIRFLTAQIVERVPRLTIKVLTRLSFSCITFIIALLFCCAAVPYPENPTC